MNDKKQKKTTPVAASILATFDQIVEAIAVLDEAGKLVFLNTAAERFVGQQRDTVIGLDARQYLPGIALDAYGNPHLEGAEGQSYTQEIPAADGMRRVAVSLSRIDIDGKPHFTALFRDLDAALERNIAESKQIERLQRDVLEAIASDHPIEDVMLLLCRRVEQIAPDVVCSILGVDEERRLRPLAAPSMPPGFAAAIDGLPVGPATGSCGTAAWRGEPVLVEDIETDPLWVNYMQLPLPLGLVACWSHPIKLRDGRCAGTFAFYYRQKRGPSAWHQHIVSACVHLCVVALERHDAKAHIAKLAYFDTLTGLPNRAQLREQISRAITSPSQRKAAVLFLDIDRFKDVNDMLGHATGDRLLVEFAKRLGESLRPGDVVSRHGGDEFVVILPDCDSQLAANVADRLLAGLEETIDVDGHALPVSASIGISLFPEDGDDETTLLMHADTAMYEAKSAGRGTYRFFSREMNRLAQERLVLGAALRDALNRGLLHLHYQPQIRTADGTIHGVEALARWTHPTMGPIPPDRFIALAETSGLIEQIGDWALNEACRQLADWRSRGVHVPHVAVNLSPLHFRNRDLFQTVKDTLARHNLPPEALTVEITEGVIMDDCPAAIENAKALHDFGVRLSMDDFGTGYSSLSYLARLPVSELKIDRGFMRDLDRDLNTQAVVTAVIRIGQSLGLTVVAEGVETLAHRRFLAGLNCHALQGYLFSRPLPPRELEGWLMEYLDAQLPLRRRA